MRTITGELNELGSYIYSRNGLGGVQYIKINGERLRKMSCTRDVFDYLNSVQGTKVSLFVHSHFGFDETIIGVKNEETADSLIIHLPTFIVWIIKIFILLEITFSLTYWLIAHTFFNHRGMGADYSGEISFYHWVVLVPVIILALQIRSYIQARTTASMNTGRNFKS